MSQPTLTELRELDAWIAEHVMGAEPDLCNEWLVHRHINGGRSASKLPNYTTDRNAAMEVLEKCAAVSDKNQIHINIKPGKCVVYCNRLKSGEANTLPLAIALFAKALYGGEQ